MTELALQERRKILQDQIAKYSRKGYQIVSQTDTTAQMRKPKIFSFLWAFLWFLLFGVGILVYIFYYMAKKDTIVFIEVSEEGRVRVR